MEPFSFHAPTKITFGDDTAGSACDVIKEFGGKKTLIISDANLIKAGLLTPVLDGFAAGEVPEPVIFDQVPPDSDVHCVNNVAALARESGCDSLVAIGGGSVMDTAKVANICLTYGGDMLEYQGLNNLPSKLR